jgi:hypothetical protein
MADEISKEGIERRAQELARRIMSKPYQKLEWPKTAKGPRSHGDASSARKTRSTDEAS